MTASAPQPGDTHLTDGTPPTPGDGGGAEPAVPATGAPWAMPGDDTAWWRADPAPGAGPVDAYDEPTGAIAPRATAEARSARTAGAEDTGQELGGTGTAATPAPAEPAGPTGPAEPDEGVRGRHELTGGWLGDGTGGVPEVMVLPDPEPGGDRHRPTIPVPVATQTQAPVPTPRAESFWLHALERGEDVPEGELVGARAPAPAATKPVRRSAPVPPRPPALGLVALVLLALAGTFFAWVSAEPLWLAVGHSTTGTATVTRCTGDGVVQRCKGTFTADGVTLPGVTLLGVDGARATAGAAVGARMVSPDSRQAFAGATGWTLHLRWLLGVLLVLICGLGIASATGARRLENARARRRAVLISMLAPVVVLFGFLVATY